MKQLKFIKKEDRVPELFHRYETEDGIFEIGIYPVMFGYRVRAGMIDSPYCDIDLCAGSNSHDLTYLFYGVMKIISGQKRVNGSVNLREIPFNQVKPFFNDNEFVESFKELLRKYNKGIFEVEDVLLEVVKDKDMVVFNSEILSNFRDLQWNTLSSESKCSK